MAWTNLLDAVLGHKKPVTLQMLRALRDNVTAQAEGDAGAPKNLGKSMDIDIGNLSGAGAIVDLDDVAKLLLVATAVATSAGPTASIGYQLSGNNGASWTGTTVLATSYPGSTGAGTLTACAAGSRIIDMTGYNAIRLAGTGTMTGSLVCVEGA